MLVNGMTPLMSQSGLWLKDKLS